ncbi:hypothetical protein MP228_012812 [Amoeboaphelidium protococcarum]|nr:hypothetical protein MP228_012812 [Amoeboaphelidium protococcarum]
MHASKRRGIMDYERTAPPLWQAKLHPPGNHMELVDLPAGITKSRSLKLLNEIVAQKIKLINHVWRLNSARGLTEYRDMSRSDFVQADCKLLTNTQSNVSRVDSPVPIEIQRLIPQKELS